MILNIETSSKICSVALTDNGVVEFHIESDPDMQHAKVLAPYVEKCLDELARKDQPLDAVAVSIGPGSYTGLRIGLSLAKGLCFSKNVPLIGIPTMKILATKAMFANDSLTGDELFIPMIDARRMEVYTCAYDFALNEVMPAQPMILSPDSYAGLLKSYKCVMIGDGTPKAREVISSPNAIWAGDYTPVALDMNALSALALRKGDFLDLAYSTPEYLKEYQATIAKNKVLSDVQK